jgi:hypothetical protein
MGHIDADSRIRQLAAAVLIAAVLSNQAQVRDSDVELAFMLHTLTVTLLNEGGKHTAVDLNRIPQREAAGWIRMPQWRELEPVSAAKRHASVAPVTR